MSFQNKLHQCLNRVKETCEKMLIKRQEFTEWVINKEPETRNNISTQKL
jgi:hypothetical protein